MILYPVKNLNGSTIGGKAKGLLKLINEGINVPDFLVLPAENFSGIIQQRNSSAESIHDRLLRFSLSNRDLQKLEHILSGWNFPTQRVIVRSSIADEDGAQDAFAGIMSSYANISSYDDILEAIAKCAASAYSVEATSYRMHRALSKNAQPAVIVQKQITADSSGVVFSTYPQYPQEMAIHAVWGQGDGLVNGQLDADEFYLSKKDGAVVHEKIAHKDKRCSVDEEKGIQLTDVKIDQQDVPCVNDAHLKQLFFISSRLEKTNAHPQDIEFVISADKLYFVQSRHITQAIPDIVVYDNSNIQESYCGVTTPLTFNFAQRVYATVYLQTMELLSIPAQTIEIYRPVLNNLLGLVKGRIYYNINNWYRGLQLLPSFRQNKEDMERMMGLEEPVDFITDTEKTLGAKLKLLPELLSNLGRLLWAFMKLKSNVARFHDHFTNYYGDFYRRCNNLVDGKQVVGEQKQLDKELLENWTTPIVNDFYVMMMNGKVRRKLIKVGIAEPEDFLSRYFAGNQQIESTQPALVMQKLAVKAMQRAELKILIIQLLPDVHDRVKKQFPEFYEEIQGFIHTYGDRTVGELKLETLTMRLSPRIFYSYLRNYLTTENTFQIEALSHLHQSAQKELEDHLCSQSYFFKKSLYAALNQLQKAIQYREGMRLERTRLFGMYRTLFLIAGSILVQKNLLQDPRDVFYLTESEIEALLLEKAELQADEIIEERKKIFDQYKKEEVAARVVVPPLRNKITDLPVDDPAVLHGTGCVPGEVIAEIMIIKGPEDNLDVSGKIVCALRTDPGWVALFPTCKGVLIEKGSALSHSVILLREFGIPTIINISGLTNKLKTGQRISMDGTSGVIKML
ncbi:hypothetical protein H7F33_19700 [Pedobacter sp. PAMC26386]|nr:hypothetical protein H7F33_19700 [Pedobacter sp. PAMC26386]